MKLIGDQFNDGLHDVPRMFAVWACKQVTDIAPTNANRKVYQPDHDPKCPSCSECDETCAHVLHCEEAGRVDALQRSISTLDKWLLETNTEPSLRRILVSYARGHGGMSMLELTRGDDARFSRWAASQDTIGWRRFMLHGRYDLKRDYFHSMSAL